ncbi:hypothetical protein ACJMK2_001338, partial [Sinanodonta woodiana]
EIIKVYKTEEDEYNDAVKNSAELQTRIQQLQEQIQQQTAMIQQLQETTNSNNETISMLKSAADFSIESIHENSKEIFNSDWEPPEFPEWNFGQPSQ